MKKFYFIFIALVLSSCSDKYIIIDPHSLLMERRMNLVIKNNDAAIVDGHAITNIQILTFDEQGKCLRVIPNNNVDFDENNIFATTLTVPKAAISVTVLANAIGYTYPSQQLFVGSTLSDIFLSTTHTASVPPHYYQEPLSFFEGSSPIVDAASDADVIQVSVGISRVVSKIVVQLAEELNFTSNSGKGFNAVNASQKIYINGIDSIFIIDTPAGINLTQTEYLSDAIGFEECQIYKLADFEPNQTGMLSDDVVVFPQIEAPQLPYVILSVTGTKGLQQIGKGNPLYYGMRIKNITLATGAFVTLESLPRNVVIVVTINGFSGVGSSQHPNPDFFNTLDVFVDVKSWGEYYESSGNLE